MRLHAMTQITTRFRMEALGRWGFGRGFSAGRHCWATRNLVRESLPKNSRSMIGVETRITQDFRSLSGGGLCTPVT